MTKYRHMNRNNSNDTDEDAPGMYSYAEAGSEDPIKIVPVKPQRN